MIAANSFSLHELKGKISSARRHNWNAFFVGFLALAAVACGIAVYAAGVVVPKLHDARDMSHGKQHPSFDAPDLKRHNAQHKHEFESAYHMPDRKVLDREVEESLEAEKKEHNQLRAQPAAEKQKAGFSTTDAGSKTEIRGDAANQKYHMVFSTSCSGFQNWQALAFFYFAHKVRQPGTVTRLVSGCTDEEEKKLKKIHKERVVPLQIPGLQTFEMHVTPGFDDSGGGSQKYWNKPNGLLHWMEESLGFDGKSDHEDDDAIVIILDPDMMLLRPITADFSSKNYAGGWATSKNTKEHVANNMSPVDYSHDVVTHGRPHAQQYGFGSNWLTSLKGRLEEVVGPDSPALKLSLDDANDYYPAGPPYLATAKDMYQIAVHWVKFLPKVHEIFEPFMCEMHAYSVAAAHLELPHKLGVGFMVSDVDSDEEFGFVDKLMPSEVCMAPPALEATESGQAIDLTDSTTMVDPVYKEVGIATQQLPFVLHYCQRYALGRWFFSKYKLREDIFTNCTAPLLREPPRNVAELYQWYIFPNGIEKLNFASVKDEKWKQEGLRVKHLRHGWLLCAVLYGINGAIEAYKTETCQDNSDAFQKTWHFHDEVLFDKMIADPSIPSDLFEPDAKTDAGTSGGTQ